MGHNWLNCPGRATVLSWTPMLSWATVLSLKVSRAPKLSSDPKYDMKLPAPEAGTWASGNLNLTINQIDFVFSWFSWGSFPTDFLVLLPASSKISFATTTLTEIAQQPSLGERPMGGESFTLLCFLFLFPCACPWVMSHFHVAMLPCYFITTDNTN